MLDDGTGPGFNASVGRDGWRWLWALVQLGWSMLAACAPPPAPDVPAVRGPGLPPTALEAPFRPWADEVVDEAGLLARGERAEGEQDGVTARAVRELVPTGVERARVDYRGRVEITFSREVCPEGEEATGTLRLEPAVEGKTTWERSDRLVFTPKVPWQPSTRIRGVLRAELCSNASLSADHPIDVVHRPLKGARIAADVPLGPKEPFQIWLYEPVRREDLAAALRVGGVAVEVRVHGDEDDDGTGTAERFEVLPATAWPRDTELDVEVRTSLRGLGGARLEETERESLRTWGDQQITAGCPSYRATESCRPGVADARAIELQFRNPLRGRVVPGVTITPRPKGLRMSLGSPTRFVITGDLALGETYEVTVPPGVHDIYGQQTTEATTLSFTIGEPPPTVELALGDDGGGDLPATLRGGQAVVGLETRRVRSVRLRIAQVPDAQLAAFFDGGDEAREALSKLTPFSDEIVSLTPKGPTQFSSMAIDLAPRLKKRRGAFVVRVLPEALADPEGPRPAAAMVRVQVASMGLTLGESARHGHSIRAASLVDGRPVAGVRVRAVVLHREHGAARSVRLGTTDAAGTLHAARLTALDLGERVVLVGEGPRGDVATLPGTDAWALDGRDADPLLAPHEELLGRVITERGMYQPGQDVHVVGWGKIGSPDVPLGRRALPRGTELSVRLEVDGDVVQRKVVTVGAQGKVAATLTLPPEAPVGRYDAVVVHPATKQRFGRARFGVEHYRAPTFRVHVKADRTDLAHAHFEARARHYSGEPMTVVGATVGLRCRRARPSRYDFGLDENWQLGYEPTGDASEGVRMEASTPSMTAPAEVVTADIDGSSLPVGRSARCGVEVDMLSRTLQSQKNPWPTSQTLYGFTDAIALRIAHPRKVGLARTLRLRAVRYTGDSDEQERIAWPEPVTVTLTGEGLGRPLEVCRVRVGRFADARCRIPEVDTAYGRFRVEVRDARGLVAATSFWGSTVASPPTPSARDRADKRVERCATFEGQRQCHEVEPEEGFDARRADTLSVVPEVPEALVGEKIRVAVVGPWDEAPGLLLVRTVAAAEHIPFVMKRGRAEVAITVGRHWEPGVELRAWVTPPPGGRGREVRRTVRHHEATARLRVDDRARKLQVTLTAPKEGRVRETKTVAVQVRDGTGAPVKARVALWVTNQAVLELSGYDLPSVGRLVTHPTLGSMVVSERFDATHLPYEPREEETYFVHGTGQGFGSGHGRVGRSHRARPPRIRRASTSVEYRKDFRTTPLFIADLETDATGRAEATVTLPDDITSFAVLAVASAGLDDPEIAERFGRDRSSIRVTKSVVITGATPRQLRPKDTAEVAAVVRNNGPDPVTVMVSAEAEGVLRLRGAARPTTLAAGAEERVPFEVTATKAGGGTVRFRADVHGEPSASDAVELPLDAVPERLRYLEDGMEGVIEGAGEPDETAVTVPVELARGVEASTIEARVTLGRSPVTGLESAAASLMRFPYGCVEQLSSRVLPIIAVRELRDLGLVDQNPDTFVRATLRDILDHQRRDGSFGLWSSQSAPHAYGSAYATWVLVQADRAGYAVPSKALEAALEFAQKVHDVPSTRALRIRPEARTLALWAIAMHDASSPWVEEKVTARLDGDLPKDPFALGTLALAFATTAGDDHENRARLVAALKAALESRGDQAGLAGPVQSYGAPMGAEVAPVAAVLMALLQLAPEEPVIDKLARGILAMRRRGRWAATQDNAYALFALARYATHVGAPQAVRGKVWVGTEAALAADLDDEAPVASSPWKPLVTPGIDPSVTVQRLGSGPMHYQLRVRRMRPAGQRPPDHVLKVSRRLRTSAGPVTGAVEAGQILALDVEFHASAAVDYVAIDIPVPAGLEPAIAGLRTQLDRMIGDERRARSDLVVHEQALPGRVVLFADRVRPGRHRHTVYVRAVTPGIYDFPAARAMAQYAPALQGWSSSGRLTVTSP